jgi:hypothetical protein
MTTKKRQGTDHEISCWTFPGYSEMVAKKARDQALAAGLTVTVYKEGKLIQQRLTGGKIVVLNTQRHEDDNEF